MWESIVLPISHVYSKVPGAKPLHAVQIAPLTLIHSKRFDCEVYSHL